MKNKNNMKFKILSSFLILFVSFSFISPQKPNPEITISELRQHIAFLASDEMKGRKPGTAEDKLVASYIQEQFKRYGLKLSGNKGFQPVHLVAGVELGVHNALTIEGRELKLMDEFIPLSFSESATLISKLSFVGFGYNINNDTNSWDDYEGVDVSGNWVLILNGEPKQEGRANPFEEFSALRTKVLTARDHGASGVLFVNSVLKSKEDELPELAYDKVESTAGIPVIHIDRKSADLFLSKLNYSVEILENEMNEYKKPHSFALDVEVKGVTELLLKRVESQNIIAMVKGSDPLLKNEYIVVGAHYDHLGMGGQGSGSRNPDIIAVHNGADDNASGVAGVIELAGKFQSIRKELKRSIVFVAFTGEEMGLLGSRKFVESELFANSNIKAMINFDMIGRMNKETLALLIGGSGSAVESDSLLNLSANKYGFKLKLSPEGYGPSDHASFYAKDIPVIFISTGPHADYHTSLDDIDKIDFEGQRKVLWFSYDLIKELAAAAQPLTFKDAGPKERSSSGSYKITLGIMPDFAAGDVKGLRVEVVRKGGPAYQGGMLDGDIITALNGLAVGNIYDYMNRLKKLNKGDSITVDVLREGKTEVLIIQL